jgi:hypothetical protein
MKHSTSDLHVVYSYSEYGGISLAAEDVFTDKAEAETHCESINREALAMLPQTSVVYRVMTLYDFMSQAREDARDEGRRQERDS